MVKWEGKEVSMSSPASIAKHPIHPMLVVFPVGLWIFSFVCDLIHLLISPNPIWSEIAFYCIGGGIVGALLAAIPGFIDYLSITNPRAKRIATFHLVLNLIGVVLFALNFGLRYAGDRGASLPIIISAITIVAVGISGWLGGELVYVHGMGVATASSSREDIRRVG
jgi:uncharacterized membrane protein